MVHVETSKVCTDKCLPRAGTARDARGTTRKSVPITVFARTTSSPAHTHRVVVPIEASPFFGELWSVAGMGQLTGDLKTISHPELGDVTLDCDVLTVPGVGWSGPSTRSLSARVASYRDRPPLSSSYSSRRS